MLAPESAEPGDAPARPFVGIFGHPGSRDKIRIRIEKAPTPDRAKHGKRKINDLTPSVRKRNAQINLIGTYGCSNRLRSYKEKKCDIICALVAVLFSMTK